MRLLGMARLSRGVPLLCLFVSSAFILSGCDGGEAADQPNTVPVDGVVTYKGEPVEGATVVFFMEDAPRAASGVTDAEGKYKLTMYDRGDGTVVGTHQVTVTKVKAGAAMSDADMQKMLDDPSAMAAESEMTGGPTAPGSELPEKYSVRATSGLTADVVAEGRNTFPFELTD